MAIEQNKEQGFTAACKDYYGLRAGETLHQFVVETNALTMHDKKEIKAGLEAQGYIIKPLAS